MTDKIKTKKLGSFYNVKFRDPWYKWDNVNDWVKHHKDLIAMTTIKSQGPEGLQPFHFSRAASARP